MKRNHAALRTALEGSPHFESLASADLQALASVGHMHTLRGGAPCKEGLCLVVDGALRVTTTTAQGQEFVYAYLGKGEFIGFAEIVDRQPSPLAARAAGTATVALFPTIPLRALCDARPALWRHFAGLLYDRLVQTLLLARDLSVAPLQQRLASRLLWQALAATHGSPKHAPITVHIGQSDLARMLGSGRSAVNAALKRLEDQGVVRTGYRSVQLLDTAALRQVAGPDLTFV